MEVWAQRSLKRKILESDANAECEATNWEHGDRDYGSRTIWHYWDSEGAGEICFCYYYRSSRKATLNTRDCFSVIAGPRHLLAYIQRRRYEEERKHIIPAITAAVAASRIRVCHGLQPRF